MALVMGAFGGLYYWGPKITGYMLNETIGKIQFCSLHWHPGIHHSGLHPGSRRDAAARGPHPHDPQWQTLNQISTLGAILIGISTIAFVVNIAMSWKKHPAGDNPWDAHTLEWFTTSPPPHHNYYRLPQIRSERPTWDYKPPEHKTAAHGHHEEHHDQEVPVS